MSLPPGQRRRQSLPLHRPLRGTFAPSQSRTLFLHPRFCNLRLHVPLARRNSKLRKAESMVHYWDARVPFWNGKGSPADLAGQKVRDNIKAIETKARNRYDALY